MSPLSTRPGFDTAIGRWAALGPYYAMFPLDFVFKTVSSYSTPGSAILDPFAGRGSSVYAAAALGRTGVGIEINPVGWLYGKVKLKPASKASVQARLEEVGRSAKDKEYYRKARESAEFFKSCYSSKVLRFLLSARDELDWKESSVDATLMALILVYLHGKEGQALSNQMRQTKAMAPDYSIQWWDERGLEPPDIDPLDFLTARLEWRYAKGKPSFSDSCIALGDSTQLIKKLRSRCDQFDLLLTSPPYFEITNYYYDQWLRLWMLGGPDHPHMTGEPWKGKFASQALYRELLLTVFRDCATVMNNDAVIYVRTDSRPFTAQTTKEVLREAFPEKSMTVRKRPLNKSNQTALFGDKVVKPGEIDIILQ